MHAIWNIVYELDENNLDINGNLIKTLSKVIAFSSIFPYDIW